MNIHDWRPPNAGPTRAVTLKIGDQTWKALSYIQYGSDMLYVPGDLPRGWSNQEKFGFLIDDRWWYIMSYLTTYGILSPSVQQYHPFGNHWTMTLWGGHQLKYPLVKATIE